MSRTRFALCFFAGVAATGLNDPVLWAAFCVSMGFVTAWLF